MRRGGGRSSWAAANSAGQAAVFLSRTARRVHMLVAVEWAGRQHVAISDSTHRRHARTSRCGPDTEIVALEGDEHLEQRALARQAAQAP